jgi:hypothetical protein
MSILPTAKVCIVDDDTVDGGMNNLLESLVVILPVVV